MVNMRSECVHIKNTLCFLCEDICCDYLQCSSRCEVAEQPAATFKKLPYQAKTLPAKPTV